MIKRNEAIRKLIQKEAQCVDRISPMLDALIIPMKTGGNLLRDASLFEDYLDVIEELHKRHSRTVLKLCERYESLFPNVEGLGRVLEKLVAGAKSYVTIAGHSHYAYAALSFYCRLNPMLNRFVEEQEGILGCTLQHYFTRALNDIDDLVPIIEELAQNTPVNHCDQSAIKNSLANLKRIQEQVPVALEEAPHKALLLALAPRIHGYDLLASQDHLGKPIRRRYKREGKVVVNGHKRYVFVFDDVLLVCNAVASKRQLAQRQSRESLAVEKKKAIVNEFILTKLMPFYEEQQQQQQQQQQQLLQQQQQQQQQIQNSIGGGSGKWKRLTRASMSVDGDGKGLVRRKEYNVKMAISLKETDLENNNNSNVTSSAKKSSEVEKKAKKKEKKESTTERKRKSSAIRQLVSPRASSFITTTKPHGGHSFDLKTPSLRATFQFATLDTKQVWMKDIKNAIQRLKPKGVFGSTLVEVLLNEKQHRLGIPYVVYSCVNYLSRNAITKEDLFTQSGSSVVVEQLQTAFDLFFKEGGRPPSLEGQDPFNVADLIKLYFRELPEPLMTYNLYDSLTALEDVKDPNGFLQQLQTIIFERLPSPNRALLQYLLNFLKNLSFCADINGMKASTLALIFGPALIGPREVTLESHLLFGKIQRLVQTMIERYDDVFFPALFQAKLLLKTSDSNNCKKSSMLELMKKESWEKEKEEEDEEEEEEEEYSPRYRPVSFIDEFRFVEDELGAMHREEQTVRQ
ncbi:Kinesin-like protein kif3a, variant 2 [Balamuthia mandrillaris]